MDARIIKTTGETIFVEPKNRVDFSLEELQQIVDGYIEIVQLGNNECMVVNEDGHSLGMNVNIKATNVYGYDVIVGDVLICNVNQIK